MGYYTNYALTVDDYSDEQKEVIEREIEKMNVFEDGDIDSGYYVDDKWYNCNEDMLILSRRFPNVLFTLSGYGEGSEDIWRHFFKGGRIATNGIQIVYHDFDERNLREWRTPVGQRYSYQWKPENGASDSEAM